MVCIHTCTQAKQSNAAVIATKNYLSIIHDGNSNAHAVSAAYAI
jgi:hypothetical protein